MEQLVKNIINRCKEKYHLKNYLADFNNHEGRIFVVAIGKAAYDMAKQAQEVLGDNIYCGIVLTKYRHCNNDLDRFTCLQAGHPILDENGIIASEYILKQTANLNENDKVIMLISGGGSALFEKPVLPLDQLQNITKQLLNRGASINEINVVRKHLSLVKGGKFAKWCKPAQVYNFIISDVIGNDLSTIASGPCIVDSSTNKQARDICAKYDIECPDFIDTVHKLDNVHSTIIADCNLLVEAAKEILQERGYLTTLVNNELTGNIKDVYKDILNIAIENQSLTHSHAFIFAGETTVEVKGNGLGGRNQELVCHLIEGLKDTHDTTILSFSSDGTDGPTDATGGYADSLTYLKSADLNEYLENNDSYHFLKKIDQLIITGPTNTNINDLTIVIINR